MPFETEYLTDEERLRLTELKLAAWERDLLTAELDAAAAPQENKQDAGRNVNRIQTAILAKRADRDALKKKLK